MRKSGSLMGFIGVGALALVILSCGKKAPTGAEGDVDAATAKSIATGSNGTKMLALANGTDVDSAQSNFGSSSSSASTRRAFSEISGNAIPDLEGLTRADDCNPTFSGQNIDTDDADGDKIVDRTGTFNCNSTSSGVTYKVTGSVVTVDKSADKKAPLGGARFEVKDFNFDLTSTTRATNSLSFKINGFFNLENPFESDDKKFSHSADFAFDITANGKTGNIWYTMTKNTITVDDSADPKKSGKMNFVGLFGIEFDGKRYALDFTTDGQDVTYDKTCTDKFKNGSVFFVNAKKEKIIKYTFTDCTLKRYVDGVEVTATSR